MALADKDTSNKRGVGDLYEYLQKKKGIQEITYDVRK